MRDYSSDDNEFRGKLDSDPLPDEIARRAAEIRAAWDSDEEQKRREVQILPWIAPITTGLSGLSGNGGLKRRRPRHNVD
jgi:hypothetical protein